MNEDKINIISIFLILMCTIFIIGVVSGSHFERTCHPIIPPKKCTMNDIEPLSDDLKFTYNLEKLEVFANAKNN